VATHEMIREKLDALDDAQVERVYRMFRTPFKPPTAPARDAMIRTLLGIADETKSGLFLRRVLGLPTSDELHIEAVCETAQAADRSAEAAERSAETAKRSVFFGGIAALAGMAAAAISLIGLVLWHRASQQPIPPPPQPPRPAVVTSAAPAIAPTTTQAADPLAARPDR